jgi:hypothetical protein
MFSKIVKNSDEEYFQEKNLENGENEENEKTDQKIDELLKKVEFSLSPPKKSEKKVKEKKEKSKRVITNHSKWRFSEEELRHENQYKTLCEIQREYNPENSHHRFIVSQIKNKIYGYCFQDETKEKFSETEFVDLSNVLQKLVDCKMECFYCTKKVKVLYEFVREESQWTLERIDNTYGHNTNNVEIACLACNLKRRTMYHERFIFTKQFSIKKIGDH